MPKEKWTTHDMPSQQGRVAVITGGNTGLGYEIAKALAAHGATVVLAVRNTKKGEQAAGRIARAVPGAKVAVQALDVASLDSVRAAAEELRAKFPAIHMLINNAGVMCTPQRKTADGFELQFGTNHLGHFALTGLLLPAMLAAPGSRVVTVSSIAHKMAAGINFDDLQSERPYDRLKAYGMSKLANLMFTYELQRRFAAAGGGMMAVAAHPGTARTGIMRNSPFYLALAWLCAPFLLLFVIQSAAMGALPILRAATDPNVQGGEYYAPGGRWPRQCKGYPELRKSSPQSYDAEAQRRLWAASEELTGVKFPV